MANPLKTLRRLVQLHADGRTDLLLKPEEVAAGLEAVSVLLRGGLPDKDSLYEDPRLPEAFTTLASFYTSHGSGNGGDEDGTAAGKEDRERGTAGNADDGGDGSAGAGGGLAGGAGRGDRLYRSDLARLGDGLADVADRMALAATLRKARREAGYSIRELARFAGVDHSYVSRVERGAVPRPSAAVMKRLSGPLGLHGWPGVAVESQDEDATSRMADLGLHRPPVRALLKILRDLPDEYLELLIAQARAMGDHFRKKRG